jgi:hypothetical protein
MALLAAAAPVLGLVGAGVSAGGALLGGIAQGNAASYQAQVAQNNAQIAQQNATYSLQAGNAKVEQAGLKAAEDVGAAKTALAANNVDVNSGSALDVETGTRQKGALNQYTIANDAELQAYGYRTQATGFEAQAGLDDATATEAPIGAAIGATGSLLSDASALPAKFPSFFGAGDNANGASASNPWTPATATVAWP